MSKQDKTELLVQTKEILFGLGFSNQSIRFKSPKGGAEKPMRHVFLRGERLKGRSVLTVHVLLSCVHILTETSKYNNKNKQIN